jgi:hypothetical protein
MMHVYHSHNKEIDDLFSSPDIIRAEKSRIVRWRKCSTQGKYKKIKHNFSLKLRREESIGKENSILYTYVRIILN